MILSIPTGLSYYLFVPMLYFLNFYFTPVHAIFGDYFVRISEFGMNPQGIRGYVAAICFYAAVSYAAANILALFRSKNTHADPSGESEPK
ncbi:MAG TPA: hypothetical protein VL633_06750 [Bacteroidota bacterium]|nr:hypothetical protein [Bacteroidota bacterium]